MLYKRIGQILLDRGLLSSDQISVLEQKSSNELFGQKAVNFGFLKENDLMNVLAEIYTVPIISLEFLYIDEETLRLLGVQTCCDCRAIVFESNDKVVKVAIADPGNILAIDRIRNELKDHQVKFFLAKESEISRFIEMIKSGSEEIENNPLMLLNKIIFEALEEKASDIHFESFENMVRVRFRINGILQLFQLIDIEPWNRIKSRLKLISQLKITENRRPQSGHTRISLAGKTVDLRISTHPGIFGENFVIRIFDLSEGVRPLSKLSFEDKDFQWLRKIISHPNGIFLIIGPTGAGKTTTLYSLLKELNSSALNIMTLEDPVEYQVEGIRQLDLQEEGILTFADGIKSILRQDPDIILIGEIRDENTAAMAVRASLTGRLVIATLHAASPVESLRRLMDFKLKLSDFIPSLLGVFSQRLVRRKEGEKYTHRFPLTEYIFFNEDLKNRITQANAIVDFQLEQTFRDSAQNALEKQLTDVAEIRRVLGHECI